MARALRCRTRRRAAAGWTTWVAGQGTAVMRAFPCTTAWPSRSTARAAVLTQLPLVPVPPSSKAAADVTHIAQAWELHVCCLSLCSALMRSLGRFLRR